MQLPKAEKWELCYILQENLDDELEENTVTKEQWKEVKKRQQSIEDGTAKRMSGDEFLSKLNTLRNELRSKRSKIVSAYYS